MVKATDVSRLFLQAVISRKYISDDLIRILWKKCHDAVRDADADAGVEYNEAGFEDFIDKTNESLNPVGLEMRSLYDEVTGIRMWALVNTKGDEISQMATDYTPQEMAFFKQIIEQIITAPNEAFSVSSMAALRTVNNLPVKSTMTKSQAEAVLGSFVARNWLVKSSRGRYSLSGRSLLELLPYLKSTYDEDMLECTLCLEVCTRGVACYTPACKGRLHDHCYKRYRASNARCPACAADWSRADKLRKVGEEAAKDGDDRRSRRQRTGSTNSGDEDELAPNGTMEDQEMDED
ncbi:hypothetical protein BOTBODRAFT_29347 [Botryobasidium botryosum FD-172 SS1]|uniref:Non-structural maintenance of chromosomes element 1 homolog n=1 Tax=Botryobasidium botryosum (strain FD-172 SS1) TaxID=930990 RepID=A0A067MQK4_BOTB1|nr:hypothetical protein BOTBODRAFT_29347 [Botryobasidium botryosum FD-172 SS1]